MGKWLKVDASAADAYVTKTLGYTPGVDGAISVEFDLVIPGSVLTSVVEVDGSPIWSRLTEAPSALSEGVACDGSTFIVQDEGGGSTTGGPGASSIAPSGDTAMDVFWSLTNTTSGNFWTVQGFIDGSSFVNNTGGHFSGTDVGTLEFTTLDIGAILAAHDVGEVYYIDNVVVKDTDGTVLFSDDFESGDLSAWDTTTGDATVVDFSPSGGGTSTPGGDDCASAADLGAGTSGTIIDDNEDWAGTWPTGADPLWNYYAGEDGGGAPRFWSWTNPGPDTVDFQLRRDDGLDINAAVMVGTCGALTITNEYGVTTNAGQSQADMALGATIDAIVPPGETVYVEVDAYYDNPSPSEPPTGHRAFFTLHWAVVGDVTFYDAIGLPTSELLADDVAGVDLSSASITVLDGIRVGDAYYFLWKQDAVVDGVELWGGKINADGTGLATAKIADYSSTVPYFYDESVTGTSKIEEESGNGPMLASDGTRVWAGFFTFDHSTGINWRDGAWTWQMYCPDDLFAEFITTRTPAPISAYRGHLYEWSGSTWDLWQSLDQDDLDPHNETIDDGARGPETSDTITDARVEYLTWKMTASPEDPDHVWVYASYAGARRYIDSYLNDYPMCSTGPCGCPEAHWSLQQVYEVVDSWRIADGVPAAAIAVLTSDGTAPADGDTVNIAGNTYTFRTSFTIPVVAREVKIAGSAANALANLRKAIMGTGVAGTDYSKTTSPSTFYKGGALTPTTLEILTTFKGSIGNAYPSTESSAHLSFGGSTFSGGSDYGVPLATRIASVTYDIGEVTGYDKHLNPAFDTAEVRFTTAEGPWLTGGQPAPSVGLNALWLFNDRPGGQPILCVNPRDTFSSSSKTVKDTVEFWDYDGTLIQSNPASDYLPGGTDSGSPSSTAVYVSDVFANSDSGNDERFVALHGLPPSTDTVARIISTCDDDPVPIDGANIPLSDAEAFSRSWFCDVPRNYWSVGGSDGRVISNYDELCYHNWVGAWNESVEGLTPLPSARRFGLQRGYWQADEPPYVILFNSGNEIRKYTVDRDYYICSIGMLADGLYAWHRF